RRDRHRITAAWRDGWRRTDCPLAERGANGAGTNRCADCVCVANRTQACAGGWVRCVPRKAVSAESAGQHYPASALAQARAATGVCYPKMRATSSPRIINCDRTQACPDHKPPSFAPLSLISLPPSLGRVGGGRARVDSLRRDVPSGHRLGLLSALIFVR